MKLIIQIPCYNEEKTLPLVLAEIPKKIEGISTIETMIIDDGSADKTIEVAEKLGINHIVKHTWNKGLWTAFRNGVYKALEEGADILINTDWDNQYPWKFIPDLVKPILDGKADVVIWDRQTAKVAHFSPLKKSLQWLWSSLVRFLSWSKVPDSVSWFRAYSRESLMELNVTTKFSYVLDTIVQSTNKGLKLDYVKITTHAPTRPSRLFKSIWQHIRKSTIDLFRVYAMHKPLRLFFALSVPFFLIWFIGIWRFLYLYYLDPIDTGRIQSLILSWTSLLLAFQLLALWIIWDLINKNKILIEQNLNLNKRNIFKK